MKTLFLALILATLAAPSKGSAQLSCDEVFHELVSFQVEDELSLTEKSGRSVARPWRQGEGAFGSFRSNVQHYWAWLRAKTGESRFLNFVGLVNGDAHPLNLVTVRQSNGRPRTILFDLDDAGVGAFFGDAIRFVAGAKLFHKDVKVKDLFAAYRRGLTGEPDSMPSWVLKKAAKSDAKSDREALIEKYTEGGHFKYDPRLKPLEESPARAREVHGKLESLFLENLKDADVLDVVYRPKYQGGSKGMIRFWYLVRLKGQTRIIEFKQMTDPAVSQYFQQPSPEARVELLKKFTDIYSLNLARFDFMMTKEGPFLVRERAEDVVDLEGPLKDDQVDEYLLHQIYMVGRYHGRQPGAVEYVRAIENAPDQALEDLRRLARDYREVHNGR